MWIPGWPPAPPESVKSVPNYRLFGGIPTNPLWTLCRSGRKCPSWTRTCELIPTHPSINFPPTLPWTLFPVVLGGKCAVFPQKSRWDGRNEPLGQEVLRKAPLKRGGSTLRGRVRLLPAPARQLCKSEPLGHLPPAWTFFRGPDDTSGWVPR